MKKLLIAVVSMLAPAAFAADWPQFRGPERDGVSRETGLLKKWPKDGPKLLWTAKTLGEGYSGPAVVGDRLYILGTHDNAEHRFALAVKDGKELWKVKLGPVFTFKGNEWGKGPRATPTVADGLVYALGGGGELVCVKAADGTEVWRKNLPRELSAEVN